VSAKKHIDTLTKLSAHPTARNIEWSDLLAALSSIGDLRVEKNGHYEFTRNGHHLVFAQTNNKDVDVEEVVKLRHFLHASSFLETDTSNMPSELIVAISYHEAFISHNPNSDTETHKTLHANLKNGRILHKHRTSSPFNDTSPLKNDDYYDAVIDEMLHSTHIVLLCHGTSSSNASVPLLDMLHKDHSEIIGRIIAVENCDLENMTEPQLIQRGAALLKANR
jgi:hypothetical protein